VARAYDSGATRSWSTLPGTLVEVMEGDEGYWNITTPCPVSHMSATYENSPAKPGQGAVEGAARRTDEDDYVIIREPLEIEGRP